MKLSVVVTVRVCVCVAVCACVCVCVCVEKDINFYSCVGALDAYFLFCLRITTLCLAETGTILHGESGFAIPLVDFLLENGQNGQKRFFKSCLVLCTLAVKLNGYYDTLCSFP